MFNSGYSLEQYRIIESDFLIFIDYVPLEEDHLNVHSPRLADIIQRCCTQIDTFFREWIMCSCFDEVDNIESYRRGKMDIERYRGFFEPNIHLSDFDILIRNLETPRKPFREFGTGQIPSWWSDHTKLKHDAFKNRNRATLENALGALSALFLLHCLNVQEIFHKFIELNLFGIDFDTKKRILESGYHSIMPMDPNVLWSKRVRTPNYFRYIFKFNYPYIVSNPFNWPLSDKIESFNSNVRLYKR
jgi:hypothetical protein